ncbi:MAG: hypothetical protein ABI718_01655 [Acidobacteriota bacterium]
MTADSRRLLILGGAGMVGLQVAREAARELPLSEIIVSSLTAAEVDGAIEVLSEESAAKGWNIRFVPAPGDIFLPASLQGRSRHELVRDRELFDDLFNDIFDPDPEAFHQSMLFRIIDEHKPDLIVDCINTATAISYQDVFTVSRRIKVFLDRIEDEQTVRPEDLPSLVHSIRALLAGQGVPQIVRHILLLHRALEETDVRVYVKVGTTGTGGMGINIPYTHSESRPSATLLSKSAIGFAHTGLLFLLARTPAAPAGHSDEKTTGDHGAIVKEVKPGAMIGFKRLGLTHVRVAGTSDRRQPGYLVQPRSENLGEMLNPREDPASYGRFDNRDVPLMMVGADTGENGFFSIGEFQAITYPRQMEYVTPEEVARIVVLEILGASTGRDVLSAIDGAITEPSYRAGVLRHHATEEMEKLESLLRAKDEDILPSVAVGHLGPPRLSKLLIESYLLREAAGTSSFEELLAIDAESMRLNVEEHLARNRSLGSLVATIGIPIVRQRGGAIELTRGPRLNTPQPSPDGSPIALTAANLEEFISSGWVDLRLANFEVWRDRIRSVAGSRPQLARQGSAAFGAGNYMAEAFIPGDVVGWLLTNEIDAMGMVGRRLF